MNAAASPIAEHCKRPESVLVLVHDRAGHVLLLERVRPVGFWQSVTGSLRWTETPYRAAVRELREETGLECGGGLVDLRHSEVFPIVPPWRERYAPEASVNREYWYRLELPARRLIRCNPAEHRRYRWVAARQAARMVFSWTNRKAIQQCVGR